MAPRILVLMLLALSLILLELPLAVKAAPDEAYGTVINVVDGNTFDIAVEKADPRIISSVERIRLADVGSPDVSTQEGIQARDFTAAVLLNKRVYLDIDDLSVRDTYGRLICVVYLTGLYGQPIVAPCFNRMLVDSGYAKIENTTNSEFDPLKWWPDHSANNMLLPEPGDIAGRLERFAGGLLNQPSEKQTSELSDWAKQAEDWLHKPAYKIKYDYPVNLKKKTQELIFFSSCSINGSISAQRPCTVQFTV